MPFTLVQNFHTFAMHEVSTKAANTMVSITLEWSMLRIPVADMHVKVHKHVLGQSHLNALGYGAVVAPDAGRLPTFFTADAPVFARVSPLPATLMIIGVPADVALTAL